MALATSSGAPMRPSACMAAEAFTDASLAVMRAVSGVATKPGATQLTRMLRDAYEAAADSVKPITPALAAAMAS